MSVKHWATYTRVSTKAQEMASQRTAIERYLQGKNLQVTPDQWYEDPAYSGKNLDRPALARLNTAIFNGEIEGVVFYSVDRFAREMVAGLSELDRWQKLGVKLVFVANNWEINPADWSGQILMKILVAITLAMAESERERILSRRQAGIEALQEKYRKARELHAAHPELSAREIAARVDVKRVSHVQYMLDHPLASVPWGGCRKGERGRTELTADSILDMLKRSFRITEIAKLYGVRTETVYSRLRELPGGMEGVRTMLAAWDQGTRVRQGACEKTTS